MMYYLKSKMSTLSVPLTPKEEKALKNLMAIGFGNNKAEATRKALLQAEEDACVRLVLESEQAVKDGKILRGNARDLLKKMS